MNCKKNMENKIRARKENEEKNRKYERRIKERTKTKRDGRKKRK